MGFPARTEPKNAPRHLRRDPHQPPQPLETRRPHALQAVPCTWKQLEDAAGVLTRAIESA